MGLMSMAQFNEQRKFSGKLSRKGNAISFIYRLTLKWKAVRDASLGGDDLSEESYIQVRVDISCYVEVETI